MNTIDGAGLSSLATSSALGNTGQAESITPETIDWFSPSIVSSNYSISATSLVDAGTSLDQIAQQIVSHICKQQEI